MPWWRQVTFAVFLLATCLTAWPQKETATVSLAQRRPPAAAVGLNGLIRLDVTVTDQAGEPIGLLHRSDFTLLDNGQPQNIVAFQASNDDAAAIDSTASVVILLDMLQVPPEMAVFEQEQTIAFLRRYDGFLLRPVTIYSLDAHGLTRIPGPSRDGNLLAKELASNMTTKVPRDSRGIPQDAIDKTYGRYPQLEAVRAIGVIAAEQSRNPGRKLLLWVGSGLNDRGSGAYLDTTYYYRPMQGEGGVLANAMADPLFAQHLFDKICWYSALLREARVSIDAFSLGEQTWSLTQPNWGLQKDAWTAFEKGVHAPAQANVMDLYKKVLAVQSGGRVVPEGRDLATQMTESVQRLAVFYTLTFEPPLAAHADEYHSLAVTIARPGLTAATSTGYYDQPYYEDAPNAVMQHVTVAELQQRLQADSKRAVTQALPNLILSERLTSAQQATLRAEVRRGEAREQFDALADESQFMAPVASNGLPHPPPDLPEQQRILSAADRFLTENTARLPNFFARRSAVTLADGAGLREFDTAIKAEPFHVAQKFDATVSYRKGAEVVTASTHISSPDTQPLWTYGTFGPLLRATLRAAMDLKKGVQWVRWEEGPDGRRAVFRFAVPADKAGYLRVDGCCLPQATGDNRYEIVPGYHGEVTINTASGAIGRVQVEADLNQFVPVRQSGLVVTYGPVEIDGRAYILPLRGVSLWRGRTVVFLEYGDLLFRTWGPYETRINEFTFDHYRMFRGEARLLPGYTPVPEDREK